jgi:WD40 repeat protein
MKILIWDITDGRIVNTLLGHDGSFFCMILISNNVLISSSDDRTIHMWNLSTFQYIKSVSNEVDVAECLVLLDKAQWIASGDRNYLIKIWNIETTSLVTSLEGHSGSIKYLVNLKRGHMVSASFDMSIKVWNYESLEYGAALLVTLRGHSAQVFSLVLLPNGNLASASEDRTVKIWNLTAIWIKIKYY